MGGFLCEGNVGGRDWLGNRCCGTPLPLTTNSAHNQYLHAPQPCDGVYLVGSKGDINGIIVKHSAIRLAGRHLVKVLRTRGPESLWLRGGGSEPQALFVK